jgi:hypothetical protein
MHGNFGKRVGFLQNWPLFEFHLGDNFFFKKAVGIARKEDKSYKSDHLKLEHSKVCNSVCNFGRTHSIFTRELEEL